MNVQIIHTPDHGETDSGLIQVAQDGHPLREWLYITHGRMRSALAEARGFRDAITSASRMVEAAQ